MVVLTRYKRPTSQREEPTRAAFAVYLRLGFGHIADPKAYDHILFVAALTAAYPPVAWRRLVWLVTAFTLGHSVTLALATLDLVRVKSQLVEVLIPVTILLTSIAGIVFSKGDTEEGGPIGSQLPQYLLAAAFGLIHGLGFSTFLRSLLGGGRSWSRCRVQPRARGGGAFHRRHRDAAGRGCRARPEAHAARVGARPVWRHDGRRADHDHRPTQPRLLTNGCPVCRR